MSTELTVKIIIAVCMIALIAGLIGWYHAAARRRLLRLAELLDERGGEMAGFPWVVLEGHYKGRPVALRLHPGGGSDNPRILYVVLAERFPLRFEIQKESMANFLSVRVGVTKDIELNDEDLNRDFVFSSPEPDRFAKWLTEVRDTVETLMKRRGVDVLAQDQELRAELMRFSGREAKPENVREILDGLCVLREALERA